MARSTWALLAANAALIVLWLVLRTAWFPGSVGCDDSLPPQPPNCDRNGTILTYLALAEVALLGATGAWLVARRLRRRS